MTEENQAQPAQEQNKTWNQQFADWFKASGKGLCQVAKEVGIHRSTLSDYIRAKSTNIAKIDQVNLDVLYKYTGLECFKSETYETQTPRIPVPGSEDASQNYETPIKRGRGRPKGSKNNPEASQINNFADLVRLGREGIDKIVENIAVQLSAYETVRQGMLKSQRYNPTAKERAEAIMETLDVLAEEVDYFRTAPESDKKVLVEKLNGDPQSFGYATQMLNIIYSGKKLDSWMLMAQPPAKIKRMMGEKE